MENRIKEQQPGLFADGASCQHWWPNQFRLLLASLAYTLIEAIRRRALFNIGAVSRCNTRRVRFLPASGCPNQVLFYRVAQRLAPD